MSKILLVEDDVAFSSVLVETLTTYGWLVEAVETGEDAKQLIQNFSFDIILLDWELPGMSGIELCERFRQSGCKIPIIFITGKGDIDSLERALQLGADDYITKPVEVRELIARIIALRRRSSNLATNEVVLGQAHLDVKLRMLKIAGREIRLTAIECSLVEYLMRHAGRAFASPDLHKSIWSSEADSGPDTVRVHISALRRKLGALGLKDFVRTIPAQGYLIDGTF